MKKNVLYFITILIFSLIAFSATLFVFADEEVSTYEKNVKLLYSHIGDIERVWQTTKGNTDKKRARVVVIDSGIDYYLPAFSDREGNTRISPLSYNVDMEKTAEEGGYDILLDDFSELKHGTQVSGVIFADEENGVKGLAPECELIFIKTPLSESGGYTIERVKKALSYAKTLKPDVVNLSLGWTRKDDPFEEEIQGLKDVRAVVVATAGNEPTSSPRYPAANPNVVGVGAFSNLEYSKPGRYGLSSYSGFGDKNLSICAPGEFYTTKGLNFGTSLAAPVVTSAIALYKSVYPDASYDKVLSDLFSSADDCGDRGRDYRYGYGALNISDFIFAKKIRTEFFVKSGLSLYAEGTEGKVLQEYPFPDKEDFEGYFGGWYKDIECKNQVSYYNQKVYAGTTFFAKITDEPTDGLFDYSVDDYGKIIIKKYLGEGDVCVPGQMIVGGYRKKVDAIGERAFRGGSGKITISDGITEIREYAVEGNYSSVFLPSTLKKVGKNAVCLTDGKIYFDGEIKNDVFDPKWNSGESPVLTYSEYEKEDRTEEKSESITEGGCNSSVRLKVEFFLSSSAFSVFLFLFKKQRSKKYKYFI